MSVRIVSLKLNQIIYAALLALAGIALLLVLIFFLTGRNKGSDGAEVYYPGVYTTSVSFGSQALTVEMVIDSHGIQSFEYAIPESISSVYPLVEPTCISIGKQLESGTDIQAVTTTSESQDTASYLLRAIELTMEKAKR